VETVAENGHGTDCTAEGIQGDLAFYGSSERYQHFGGHP